MKTTTCIQDERQIYRPINLFILYIYIYIEYPELYTRSNMKQVILKVLVHV